jgi:prepilin-type N-terminal cleavage/methylation domain-containing protein
MRYRARKGFTLVEMLVAVALTLFIMVLLSQAFAAGLEVFRQLKGIGDMEERLRTTSIILRQDLLSPHFEPGRTLSDPQFWTVGPPQSGFFRIFQGSQNTATAPVDGDGIPARVSTDHVLHFTVRRSGNTFPSYFVADVSYDPWAWGTPPPYSDWALGGSPAPASRYQATGTYTSQWAEIAYFLRPNGSNANGTPLYSLYRRQRLAFAGDNTKINSTTTTPAANLVGSTSCLAYTDISCTPDPRVAFSAAPTTNIYFNSPEDLTVPQRRFNMDQDTTVTAGVMVSDGGIPHPVDQVVASPANNYYTKLSDPIQPVAGSYYYLYAPLAGSDVLLTDVISFDVQVYYPGQPVANDFNDLPASAANPLFAGNTTPGSYGWVFDTWTNNNDPVFMDYHSTSPTTGWQSTGNNFSAPNQIVIQAIRITIRVWDKKTQQTRQVTVIQDM